VPQRRRTDRQGHNQFLRRPLADVREHIGAGRPPLRAETARLTGLPIDSGRPGGGEICDSTSTQRRLTGRSRDRRPARPRVARMPLPPVPPAHEQATRRTPAGAVGRFIVRSCSNDRRDKTERGARRASPHRSPSSWAHWGVRGRRGVTCRSRTNMTIPTRLPPYQHSRWSRARRRRPYVRSPEARGR
jgi:hypothetical protein